MKEQNYKVYSYRWLVLAIYGMATASIQLMWTTFFSITTASWQFYGFTDAVSGEKAFSLLSIIFMAGMIGLSFPSLISFEKFGFKKSVGFGVTVTGAAALLRWILGGSYTGILIATIAFAVAQPFILNSPGLVAGKWFPEEERATANGVGLLCSYAGMCIGLLLTPILIESGMSIKTMLMVYGIEGAVVALLFIIFVKEEPPTPPCSSEMAERSDFLPGIKYALKKRDFILCMIIFFCMLGVFNTFFTLIEPILRTLSHGAVDATKAGLIGVVILVVGIISSFIISMISDKDKLHRRRPYMIYFNLAGGIGFGLMLFLNSFSGLLVSAVFYGFFIVGTAPIVLTFAAESAYPTSEGTTEGLLMFAGNIAGVIFLGAATIFKGNHFLLMMTLIGVTFISVLLMLATKETKIQKINIATNNETIERGKR